MHIGFGCISYETDKIILKIQPNRSMYNVFKCILNGCNHTNMDITLTLVVFINYTSCIST